MTGLQFSGGNQVQETGLVTSHLASGLRPVAIPPKPTICPNPLQLIRCFSDRVNALQLIPSDRLRRVFNPPLGFNLDNQISILTPMNARISQEFPLRVQNALNSNRRHAGAIHATALLRFSKKGGENKACQPMKQFVPGLVRTMIHEALESTGPTPEQANTTGEHAVTKPTVDST
ncbi:hypothetical protein B0H17DRAFT_1138243 [Mycena rosella]|uniref:Uncharacterized protein n=1 Tax=Mycena rosella TaxID=1033263 RepID=A0AAD7DA70_MYCRO|nr:hypothetical protein B0H17DRAFT_1138243 [Mycena rosella]